MSTPTSKETNRDYLRVAIACTGAIVCALSEGLLFTVLAFVFLIWATTLVVTANR